MGGYLKLFFQGVFTAAFWKDRRENFRQMVLHPADYFKSLDKKENEAGAYLLGMSSTFLVWVLLTVFYVLTFGLFTLGKALVFLPAWIAVEFVCWLAGQYLLYYLGTWAFAAAYKWLTGKDEAKRIRPILFALCVSGLTSVIPGFGSLLSVAVFIIYLVIAYENVLRIERGQAVGSAVLGAVVLAVAMGLPFWLIGWAFAALWLGVNGAAGLGLMALLLHHPTYDDHNGSGSSTAAIAEKANPPAAPTAQAIAPTPMAAAQAAAPPPPTPAEAAPTPVKTAKKHKAKSTSTASSQASEEADNSQAAPDGGNAPADSSAGDNSSQAAAATPTPPKNDVVGNAVNNAVGGAIKSIGF